MSAPRRADDFYETPKFCVDRLLDRLWLPSGHWLEPSAGSGAIIRAVNAHLHYQPLHGRPRVTWEAVELNDFYEEALDPLCGTALTIGANFLDPGFFPDNAFATVIGNPPYSLAEAFVRACLPLSPHVVMLLRLNFLESKSRASFFAAEMPDVYVLPNRPSFTGKGTDRTGYGWFHWGPDRGRKSGRVEVLAEMPISERRAA